MGTLVSAVIINLGFMGFSWCRKMYLQDQQSNDVNQTLRNVFEVVSSDIRQAGEGFAEDPNFPSLVITENSGNSEVGIRRSLLTGSLPVCRQVVSGTSDAVVVVDETGSVAGCDVIDDDNNGWPDSLDIWRNYRVSNGATIRAFIYDGTGNGEFFDYNGEETFATDGSSVAPSPDVVASASITTDSHTWQNTYEANGSSRIYLIEERRYRLRNNNLELIIDNDEEQASSIVGNLEAFQVIAHIQQDLSLNSSQQYTCTVIPPNNSSSCNATLPNPYVWSQIKFIEIKPKVLISNYYSSSLETEQSQKVFPRNILNY
ncbi:MAG: PilW family protein [Crocosphaera sp.]